MRWVSVLAVLATVLGLGGCDAGAKSDAPDSWEGRQYVALGDSYTAAPTIGSLVGTPGCARFDENYPHLVAEELELELTDVSCGGANTHHMTHEQGAAGGTVAPQFDALSEETDLVTVSIGGNDGYLYATVLRGCWQDATEHPGGADCEAKIGGHVDELLAGHTERVTEVVGAIVDRAPNARVLVVGYPQFVSPTAEPCDQLPLTQPDFRFVDEVNRRLNGALAEAADAQGVGFVDLYAATEGHGMCADDPWIAGVSPADGHAPVHPYPEEQEVAADLILDRLDP